MPSVEHLAFCSRIIVNTKSSSFAESIRALIIAVQLFIKFFDFATLVHKSEAPDSFAMGSNPSRHTLTPAEQDAIATTSSTIVAASALINKALQKTKMFPPGGNEAAGHSCQEERFDLHEKNSGLSAFAEG